MVANSTTDVIRGITSSDILNGTTGYITCIGFMNGINTSAWPVNTTLYANTSGVLTTLATGLPVAVVLLQDATNGIIYINNYGVTETIINNLTFPTALSLELAWNIAYPSFYGEPTYTAGKITSYDIWDTSAKAVHIFNKTYTYTGINITQVVVTSLIGGQTLTKNLTYNGSNQVTSVTRIYTP
jgi:hypothetical protein